MRERIMRLTALCICLTLILGVAALAEQPKEFISAPAGVSWYGLTVGEEVRMGVALARAAQSISEHFDASDFSVRGADDLMTDEELFMMAALNPVEQVLSVLMMTGYVEEGTAAVAELGLEISDIAQELVARVYGRCAKMNESERAAYVAAVQRCIPDGQVTLRIGEQLTRYDFRQVEDRWMLAGIAVAQ